MWSEPAAYAALLTDLHANKEALDACLAHARLQKADRYAFLGDFVGYGADPAWVVDTMRDLVRQGAVAVMGNHDQAVVRGAAAGNYKFSSLMVGIVKSAPFQMRTAKGN